MCQSIANGGRRCKPPSPHPWRKAARVASTAAKNARRRVARSESMLADAKLRGDSAKLVSRREASFTRAKTELAQAEADLLAADRAAEKEERHNALELLERHRRSDSSATREPNRSEAAEAAEAALRLLAALAIDDRLGGPDWALLSSERAKQLHEKLAEFATESQTDDLIKTLSTAGIFSQPGHSRSDGHSLCTVFAFAAQILNRLYDEAAHAGAKVTDALVDSAASVAVFDGLATKAKFSALERSCLKVVLRWLIRISVTHLMLPVKLHLAHLCLQVQVLGMVTCPNIDNHPNVMEHCVVPLMSLAIATELVADVDQWVTKPDTEEALRR